MKLLKSTWPQLGLLLVILLAYGPVAFLHHPLKFDLITTAFPWRYFIGECLQNFQLPLWNPYQNLGYPIHADPQSGAWYPITWFIGFFRGYDIYSQSWEFLLHLFLAGLGIQQLAKQSGLNKEIGFLASLAYVCSGFFVGNAQHLPWIISASWIPFILAWYIKLYKDLSYKTAIVLALFFFMLLSGGYPAFFIVLIYLLGILFIYFSYHLFFVLEKKAETLRFVKVNVVTLLATSLFSSVVLVSIYESIPYISRGAGINISLALTGPFSPQSMISFVFPFSSVKDAVFFHTDPSMRNAYFGIVLLVFLGYVIPKRKSPLIRIFFGWAIFCLLASMGEYLPLRQWLFDYLPLMNLFRMPALFRLFTIIGFILTASCGLQQFLDKEPQAGNAFRTLLFFFFLIPALIAASLLFTYHRALIEMFKYDFFQVSDFLNFKDSVMVSASILSILSILLFLSIILFKKTNLKILAISLILILDLVLATRLNGPYTIYDDSTNSWTLHQIDKGFPSGFPKPLMMPVELNSDNLSRFHVFYNNVSCFRKQIGYDGYNPFNLSAYDKLAFANNALFNTIISKPPIYLSEAGNTPGLLHPGDTCYFLSFKPGHVRINTQTKDAAILNLLQNFYPGWRLTIDNKKESIITPNICLMSAFVPKGSHTLEFKYQPWKVIWAFWLSLGSLITALFFLGFHRLKILQSRYQIQRINNFDSLTHP